MADPLMIQNSDFLTCQQQILEKAATGKNHSGFHDNTKTIKKKFNMDEQDTQDLQLLVAVGMLVSQHPPRRSVRAILLHTAPTSGI